MCRKRRGAYPSRATKKSRRGKSLNAVFAASARISAVAARISPRQGPLGNTCRANWEIIVSSAVGTMPLR